MELQQFGCFWLCALLSCVLATELDSTEEQPVPVPPEYRFHRKPTHGIADPGSPWISGPGMKKYQFHIGRQSWLGAREHCLAQNSDLLTINSKQELDWVLSHYDPQFPNLNDRLLQIGLFIDMHDGMKQWHWVNHKMLDTSLVKWVLGEPFDHADGRERCAILRINQNLIDDVDCDVSGSMTKMYRFVCERSHQDHVKHEELNNPLWKKLQDILDFFGISNNKNEETNTSNSTLRPGEDEEDYWEMAKLDNVTTTVKVLESVAKTETSEDDIEGSGAEIEIKKEVAIKKEQKPAVIQGTKNVETNLIEDELIIDRKLEKIAADEGPKNKEDVILETASIETTRTTKPDPLEVKPKFSYAEALERNMEKLEKIVSAVEQMIDPLEGLKVVDEDEPSEPVGITSKENKEAQKEMITDSDALETDKILLNETRNDEPEQSMVETMEDMERDFEQAENETKAHPNINSGDLLVRKNHQENIELCETDGDEDANQQKKTKKVERFLYTLSKFLEHSSSKDLKSLLDDSNSDGSSLLDKLNNAVGEATQTETKKMTKLKQKIDEYLLGDEESGANSRVIGNSSQERASNDTAEATTAEEKLETSALPQDPKASITSEPTEESTPASTLSTEPTTGVVPSEDLSTTEATTIGQDNHSTGSTPEEEEEEEGYEVTLSIILRDKTTTPNTPEHVPTPNNSSVPESEDDEGNNDDIKSKKTNNETREHEQKQVDGIKNKAAKTSSSRVNKPAVTKEKSVFPAPDFSLLGPSGEIPEEIKAKEREMKKAIDATYDEFNKRIDTSALLQRIQEAETRRLAELQAAVTTIKPTIVKMEKKLERNAMGLLEKMFEDLGRNFKGLIHD